LRVLVAVHGFPPTHYAGAERAAERIVYWLARNQHEVEVFTIEKVDEAGFRVESTTQDGFTVHRLFYDVKESDDPFRNLYNNPQIGNALRQVLAGRQFDLVHLISGYMLGEQIIHVTHEFGIPIVVTLTEYWFMCYFLNLMQPTGALCSGPESDLKCARCVMQEQRRYRLPAEIAPQLMPLFWQVSGLFSPIKEVEAAVARRRKSLHEALSSADLVICPSRFIISKFAEFGFDTSRYQFIRHGLADTNLPKVEKLDEREGLHLGYVGQIKYHKGVDLIIDAVIPLLQAGHKITLDLWGPEHETPEFVTKLKQQTAPYPSIRWNGRYQGPKVWEILSGFDALIVPSRWYENSPTVILEAYKVGIPVIGTNLGGTAELIENEKSGLVFELNNAQDLKRQLERLVKEPGLLDKLRAGVPPVKTADQEVEEIFEQYTRLLERTRER
jgi:glycosyltransferase involved in cell wall biosynthesis